MIRFVVPYLIYSLAALVCFFLQSELFSCIEIFNAKPDLFLIILVFSGLKTDWKNGIAVGLVLGFWLDLLNGGYFGLNMVVYGFIGALSGMMGVRFPDRTYEGYFFTVTAMALLSGFLSLTVFNLLGANMPVGQSIAGIIFPMTFYTALITFFCLPLVWIYRHTKGRKIGRIDLLGNGVIFVRGNEKVDLEAVIARRKRYEKDHAREMKLKKELKQRRTEGSSRRERGASGGDPRDRRDRRYRGERRVPGEPPRSSGQRNNPPDGRRRSEPGRNRSQRNQTTRHGNSGRRR